MKKLYVIAHDMRSAHNVGSLFRTAEGLGVDKLYLTGYTPYPAHDGDTRLPHISRKLDAQIEKTALGTSLTLAWEYCQDINRLLERLQAEGVTIVALEQTPRAQPVTTYRADQATALVLGTEVSGVPSEVLNKIGTHLFIPMLGKKESFNVVQAAAMALYQLRFYS